MINFRILQEIFKKKDAFCSMFEAMLESSKQKDLFFFKTKRTAKQFSDFSNKIYSSVRRSDNASSFLSRVKIQLYS